MAPPLLCSSLTESILLSRSFPFFSNAALHSSKSSDSSPTFSNTNILNLSHSRSVPLLNSQCILSKANKCNRRKNFELHSVNTKSENEAVTTPFSFPSFLPPQITEIEDPSAKSMASKMQLFPVKTNFSAEPILSSCVVSGEGSTDPPLLLIHGFDSNCLEWRKLFPFLEKENIKAYAIDILGWGFSKTNSGIESFSAENKTEHLYQFWKEHISEPVVLVGSSLGGTIAIDFTLKHPDAVSKLVLIDAQGFVEGVGPLKSIPKVFAYIGVAILKSVWLRSYAIKLAYVDQNLASEDAMRVGRLHTLMPGWADAMVSFMLSGGFNVAKQIPNISKETLLLWGEEDKILEKSQALRFEEELQKVKLVWLPQSGHLPHVEKPEVVLVWIMKFRSGKL